MVRFHEHVISELLEDDNGGIVVISSGLSLHKLMSSLLYLHSSSRGTLLILSASPSQKSAIILSLQTLNHSSCANLPSEITSELPSQQRYALYGSGGAFFITSRIMIVDLLTSKLPTSKISGVIILNAHSLSDTCTEAFIVRMLRSLNRGAYVRAFSDKPHLMVSGFAKAERIMKCLFVKRLHLWPRFQVYVSEELEKGPPTVVDIKVPMSPMMKGIQKAIVETMDACLAEMRKTNKVDLEDLTVENGLFKSFDEMLRRQLDPIWHTLGKKTKQLVSDLRTLRKLLDYLVRYDSVTYLKYLDSLRASESFRSVWIFGESSYKIFEYAKKRVYYIGRRESLKSDEQTKIPAGKKRKCRDVNPYESAVEVVTPTKTSEVVIEEVLEASPKWKVLKEILEEIEEERVRTCVSIEEPDTITDSQNEYMKTVLVACKDEYSCLQLEDCILNCPQKVMRDEWEKYLLSKVELKGLQKRQKKKERDPKGFGILDGMVTTSIPGQSGEASSINKLEHDALLEAAAEITKKEKNCDVGNDVLPTGLKEKGPVHEGISLENEGSSFLNKRVHLLHKKETAMYFHALESNQHVLDILRPSVIIVYHPDVAFVREIEVFKAENPSMNLKVYFLFYDESTEVQKFDASMRRENKAFESLIRQKSLMMIPVDQDTPSVCLDTVINNTPTTQNAITRKAGGRKEMEKEMRVIVDMREFMSSLPNVLHQKGMRIVPVVLEVGDYVLSPFICVERKSIQDLFSSFSSGRLYNQVETMSRFYRMPVLLIEFSHDKSFSFQSAGDIGDDVTPNNIISKLSLLVLHFPRLRIIWSRSLHATADIFASLKSNQDEPDEGKAAKVGVPTEEGIVENDMRGESYNTAAVEFLRQLPGVTENNYRGIIKGCTGLEELVLLPVERLAKLMGGQKAAVTLSEFLHAKYPTSL